jgi:hypothetical protein
MAPTRLVCGAASVWNAAMYVSDRFAWCCEPPTQTDRENISARGVLMRGADIWWCAASSARRAHAKILIRRRSGWVVVGGGDGALVHASGACVHCLLMTTMIYLISITACINIYIHTQLNPAPGPRRPLRAARCFMLGVNVCCKILPCKLNLFAYAIDAARCVLMVISAVCRFINVFWWCCAN